MNNLNPDQLKELQRLLFVAAASEANRMDMNGVNNAMFFVAQINKQLTPTIILQEPEKKDG